IRKDKNLSQVQMAEKLGIAQVNYSKIETGKTKLISEKLPRIANILGVDLITLLFPEFDKAKYFQKLKNENDRLTKINDLLIDLVESKNNLLGVMLNIHPETKYLIEAHKSYDELEALGLRKNIGDRIKGL
ncbi:MAG: helix-turn-helix transcriptional regulator, partial [Prolixibacteraceae bacterium]|nr:helix-turn-helix transcriptional regulator [Prolixibacteraceae bacterium]